MSRRQQPLLRQWADFHLVFRYERPGQTDSGGKADDSGNDCWCGFPRHGALACPRLAAVAPERASAPRAYRKGVSGRALGHGTSLATSPDPLVERQSHRGEARDRKSRQTNTGDGWHAVGYPGEESPGATHTAASGLSTDATAAGVHPKKQRQETPTRHFDHARPSDAGLIPPRCGPHRCRDGGPELLWVQNRAMHRRRDTTVPDSTE